MSIFTDYRFADLAFKSKEPVILDTEFLDKWNNKECLLTPFTDQYLLTPVEWMASNNFVDGVKYLIENGADITQKNNYIIKEAAEKGHVTVIKYLLSTNIYSEEDIHGCIQYVPLLVSKLFIDYVQFPRTKACK